LYSQGGTVGLSTELAIDSPYPLPLTPDLF